MKMRWACILPVLTLLTCAIAPTGVFAQGYPAGPAGYGQGLPPGYQPDAPAYAPDIAPAGSIAVVVDSPLPFFVEELAGTWCTSPDEVCAATTTILRVDAANSLMVRLTAPRGIGDHVATFVGATRYSDPVRCEGDVVCERFLDEDVEITVAVTVEQ